MKQAANRAAEKAARKVAKKEAQPPSNFAFVATSTKTSFKAPKMQYAKDGSYCTVSHRERIGTVLGSVAFTTTAYDINPGLVTTFPWLSAIANRFETYSFEKLTFRFKTKTATTALGDVILVNDYDCTDSGPATSIQAESYQSFVDGAPWQDLSMSALPKDLHKLKERYVRDTTNPSGTDQKMYDVGTFYICTENQASAALVGYLYVEYTVRLMTPQLRSSDFYISGGYVDGLTGTTAANPLGTAPAVDSDARGISVDASSNITISNPGEYNFSISITGTVISAVTLTATSNCTVTSRFGTCINSGSTLALRVYKVVVTGFNAVMALAATATTVTEGQIDIASQPLNSFALMLNDVQHLKDCPQGIFLQAHADKGLRARGKDARAVPCSCQTLVIGDKSVRSSDFRIL